MWEAYSLFLKWNSAEMKQATGISFFSYIFFRVEPDYCEYVMLAYFVYCESFRNSSGKYFEGSDFAKALYAFPVTPLLFIRSVFYEYRNLISFNFLEIIINAGNLFSLTLFLLLCMNASVRIPVRPFNWITI